MALAVIPVMKGERLVSLEFESFGAEQADEPPEQPRIVEVGWAYIALPWLRGTVTTADIEGRIDALAGDIRAYETDPNSGGAEWEASEAAIGQLWAGGRVMWRRFGLTHVQNSLATTWTDTAGVNNVSAIEGKHQFRVMDTIRGGHFADAGFVAAYFRGPTVEAQTTFGFTELDAQLTSVEVMQGLFDYGHTPGSDPAKLQQLLFGGDTYIEADTLKQFAGRVYVHAKARFAGGGWRHLPR